MDPHTHAAVPALGVRIIADDASIAPLQVLLARRLNDGGHVGLSTEASCARTVAVDLGILGGASGAAWSVHLGCLCGGGEDAFVNATLDREAEMRMRGKL